MRRRASLSCKAISATLRSVTSSKPTIVPPIVPSDFHQGTASQLTQAGVPSPSRCRSALLAKVSPAMTRPWMAR